MAEQRELDPQRWIDDHSDVMYRYALTRVKNGELAEDLVQETFMAALKSAGSYSGRSTERTWLIGILKHKIIDHLRKKYREQPISQLESEETSDSFMDDLFTKSGHWQPGVSVSAWAGDPRLAASEEQFFAVLGSCLDKLPGRQGEAFKLREMDQLSSEEVQEILGITPTNLWAMLHRARSRLRVCLEKNWFQSGKKPD